MQGCFITRRRPRRVPNSSLPSPLWNEVKGIAFRFRRWRGGVCDAHGRAAFQAVDRGRWGLYILLVDSDTVIDSTEAATGPIGPRSSTGVSLTGPTRRGGEHHHLREAVFVSDATPSGGANGRGARPRKKVHEGIEPRPEGNRRTAATVGPRSETLKSTASKRASGANPSRADEAERQEGTAASGTRMPSGSRDRP